MPQGPEKQDFLPPYQRHANNKVIMQAEEVHGGSISPGTKVSVVYKTFGIEPTIPVTEEEKLIAETLVLAMEQPKLI
jgi:hypothetical protein